MHLITAKSDAQSTQDDDLVRRARPLLGTMVEIALDAPSAHLFDAAFDAIAHIHSRMSFHEDGSDISAMAQAEPGSVVTVDPHTVEVLRLAQELHRRSGGIVDVTVGKTLVQSGFLPHKGEHPISYYDGGATDIEILNDTDVRLRRPVLIDLGGIAKGYAVDFAVERLQASGAQLGIVNAGGDLRCFGNHRSEIGLRQTDGSLVTQDLSDASIASSENRYARRNRLWKLRTPHIAPGGRSIRADETVSVVAQRCAIADAMTKVAMLDPSLANDILRDFDGYVVGQSRKRQHVPMNRRSAQLARWQSRLLMLSGTALWLSGAVWLCLHFFFQVDGEFGIETHPLEAWMLRAHGLALIPALLAVGGLFVAHMPMGWKNRSQRFTGLILGGLLAILVISGYLLYYVGSIQLREWSSVIHWALGLAVPVVFIWHRFKRRDQREVLS